MESKKKSTSYYMRALHRDVGFFIIGLTVIFSVSGVVLVYRDTDFLKSEKIIEKQLSPNIEAKDLASSLKLRGVTIDKIQGDIVYFNSGTYNKSTGIANYSVKSKPIFLQRFEKLHKAKSKDLAHMVVTVYGLLFLFLAISSFWMYKPKSHLFRRGVIIAGIGIIFAVAVLFI